MPPPSRPWIVWEFTEGDSPVLKWSLQDIGLNDDADIAGATVTIRWYDTKYQEWEELEDDEVTISDGLMIWIPQENDLPCEIGYPGSHGYHEYHGQVVITFAGGEKRTLPADRAQLVYRSYEGTG